MPGRSHLSKAVDQRDRESSRLILTNKSRCTVTTRPRHWFIALASIICEDDIENGEREEREDSADEYADKVTRKSALTRALSLLQQSYIYTAGWLCKCLCKYCKYRSRKSCLLIPAMRLVKDSGALYRARDRAPRSTLYPTALTRRREIDTSTWSRDSECVSRLSALAGTS